MNSKRIEEIAILAIKNFFVSSEVVDTYHLASNDKEPFWDGNFYLYSNPEQKKEHLINKVAVQIKGKVVSHFKIDKFSYPVEISDLRAYRQNGVYYMVVQELKDCSTKIFYRDLTPIVIRNIIRAHKGQKTANVKMMPLSSSMKDVERSLLQLAYDCNRQVSFADAEPFTIEDVKKLGINSFSISEILPDKKIPSIIEITKRPNYVYANIGDKIKIPLGDGPMTMKLNKEVKANVSVNGIIYYESYRVLIENGYALLFIGECLIVRIETKENGETVINLNFKSNIKYLRKAINDASFILAIIYHREIEIGVRRWDNLPTLGDESFKKFWQESLKNWVELQETLDILHVHEDLDLSLLESKDERNIDVLINMIKYKKELSLKDKKTSIVNLKMANLNLWLLEVKLKKGNFRLFNYFDRTAGIRGSYKYPDGIYQDSIYSSIETADIVNCSNIYYEDVIPSYEEIKSINPHVYERANQFGLYLLLASDLLTDNKWRRSDLLHCACSLFEWILDNDDKNYDLYELNIIQAHKRLNMFSEEDKANIERMLNDSNDNVIIKFGAYLLADNIKEAKNYWEKIDKENKQAITKLPIWKYTNGKINLPENNCYNS